LLFKRTVAIAGIWKNIFFMAVFYLLRLHNGGYDKTNLFQMKCRLQAGNALIVSVLLNV